MFERLKKFFSDDIERPSDELTMEIAAAALLIEVSKSDYEQDPSEVEKIRQLMVKHFDIAASDVSAFVDNVLSNSHEQTSLYPFTRHINDNCDNREKYQLVLALWEVAAEDGRIDKYEEHLIRKISDLVYLPHRDFIRAKLVVSERLDKNPA